MKAVNTDNNRPTAGSPEPATDLPDAMGRQHTGAGTSYLRAGTGPGLVLLHGTGANAGMWEPLLPRWSPSHTVVAPDFTGAEPDRADAAPGRGEPPLTLAGLAAQALDAADHAGLATFDLVGHSLGAAVAAELAATAPNRVRSLVLHAGWVRTDPRQLAEFDWWIRLLRNDIQHQTQLFLRYLPLLAFGPVFWSAATVSTVDEIVPLLAEQFRPRATIRQIELDQRVDLTDRLVAITAPTLVLTSRHDRLIDCASQRALVEGIAGSTQAGLDAGHGAPAENPTEFAHAIETFWSHTR